MGTNQAEPNSASEKSKAEGERWTSDSNTVERRDRDTGDRESGEKSGITNRSIEEERENQRSLPSRGSSPQGAHAGRGHHQSEESDR